MKQKYPNRVSNIRSKNEFNSKTTLELFKLVDRSCLLLLIIQNLQNNFQKSDKTVTRRS